MKVVILGAGDVGRYLASALSTQGSDVTLIDPAASALALAEEESDVMTVLGDASHRTTLQAAQVQKADLVAAVTGSDHANLVGAALAAELGAPMTVARVDDPKFYRHGSGVERGVLGVSALLCASRLVSEELLRQVSGLSAGFSANFADGSLQVTTMPVRAGDKLVGKAPASLSFGSVSLGGVVRDAAVRSPAEVAQLEPDDELVLSGAPAHVLSVLRELGQGPLRAVIVGGGDVGTQLAQALIGVERRVQLLEVHRDRCEYLARELARANIVHADGTSIARLRDERVGNADYVLSVTRKDEVNLMVSLMAKDLGAKSAMALVHRPGYAETYAHLGLTATTGTHRVIQRAIERLAPRDGLLASEALPGTGYGLFELQIPGLEAPVTVGEVLQMPEATAVGLVVEGEVRVAARGTSLSAGDRVVVAAPLSARKALGRRLTRIARGAS